MNAVNKIQVWYSSDLKGIRLIKETDQDAIYLVQTNRGYDLVRAFALGDKAELSIDYQNESVNLDSLTSMMQRLLQVKDYCM